jgi:hypothetical protein
MNEVAKHEGSSLIADIVLKGDLSALRPEQKVEYYNRFCESLGLNALTRPFQYIRLSGKEVLYATKDATEQLRKINGVSITSVDAKQVGDVYVVTASGEDKTGRKDTSTGAVPIANLKGDALANALMKAETKAKRRLTLSICGLGILDETEIETIPNTEPVTVQAALVQREIPDLEKARTEMEKLLDRYSAVFSESYVQWIRLEMDGADVDKMRKLYLDARAEGKAAEKVEEPTGKKAEAKKFKAAQLADEAEPVLPDGESQSNLDTEELF